MKVAIYGAGAIGGYLAAKLAVAGKADLAIVARGDHLAAIRTRGLRLIEAEADNTYAIRASADPAELGVQDYVALTMKAHSVPAALPAMAPLIGPETAVVTMQNGIPWWYFYKSGGPYEGTRIEAVDPGGAISAALGPERAIGAAVYVAAEVEEPGVVRHSYGTRISLGEPSGEKSERAVRLAEQMIAGGMQAPVRTEIRSEIWVKLWGNLSFNPISALTDSTLEDIVADEGTRSLARAMMVEAQTIAEKLGVRFPIDVDKRIAGGGSVGAHRTSMLQDLERGRPMEIDALVTAVRELGRLTGTPTPSIDMVLALVRRLARARGCYPK